MRLSCHHRIQASRILIAQKSQVPESLRWQITPKYLLQSTFDYCKSISFSLFASLFWFTWRHNVLLYVEVAKQHQQGDHVVEQDLHSQIVQQI